MKYKPHMLNLSADKLELECKAIALECLIAVDTTYSSDILARLSAEPTCIEKPNPKDYPLPNHYRHDSQAYAFIGKNVLFSNEENLVPELVSTFFEQEKKNSLVNNRFTFDTYDPILDQVKRNVLRLIGSQPKFVKCYENYFLADSFNYGPGSSYFFKGNLVNPWDKIKKGKVTLTTGCVPIWKHLTENTPFHDKEILIIEQDTFDFVPKNFKSLRTIAVGNCGNGIVQRVLGKALNHKLKRFFDLSKRPMVHKEVVRICSSTRSHATIDIKNASNSMCTNVVKKVIPPIWFDYLNKARHHRTQIGEMVHDLSLFSSMGNGFTFELESILFYAILMTLPNNKLLEMRPGEIPGTNAIVGDISIFGDDIICRAEDVPLLTQRLKHFGFEVNTQKSFWGESWFYESCGADFFAKADVTPYYLNGKVSRSNLQSLYGQCNTILLASYALYFEHPNQSRFARAYSKALKLIPKKFRIYGPYYERDKMDELKNDSWLFKEPGYYSHSARTESQLSFHPRMRKISLPIAGYDDEVIAYGLLSGDSSGAVVRRCVTGGNIKPIHILL